MLSVMIHMHLSAITSSHMTAVSLTTLSFCCVKMGPYPLACGSCVDYTNTSQKMLGVLPLSLKPVSYLTSSKPLHNGHLTLSKSTSGNTLFTSLLCSSLAPWAYTPAKYHSPHTICPSLIHIFSSSPNHN